MSILRFVGVVRQIGTFRILEGIDTAIAAGERIGLVGANGAGKTTLLRLAAGLDEPDGGRVERKRGLAVGLLTQEANLDAGFAAYGELRPLVRSGAAELEGLEAELAALEAAGAAGVESPRYADLQHRFEALGGYTLDQRVDEALSGLGFPRASWGRDPASLSGGEQTRAALARLVIADPDLLLLDEPTNHLDLDALEWLETALVRRRGSLVIASHDRALLDAVAVRIWELRDRRLSVFRGDYSAYALQQAERDARRRKEAEARAAQMAREQELVARYRSHRKYGKMHEHEGRLARLEPLEAPRQERRPGLWGRALFRGEARRSGDVVVQLRDAVFGFGPSPGWPDGRPLAWAPRLEASRGERIGIVGPNGIGKTTLLRTIAGELPALGGTVALGADIGVGFLAQLRDALPPGATVLDVLLARVSMPPGEARGYLARFLFRGDDVFREVTVLSGGERSRLELALLGVLSANLLLLDEPTNHLDIPAREALESFLRGSAATVLLVSHDRRLLDSVCERLWVVAPVGDSLGELGGDAALVAAPAAAVEFGGSYRSWRAAVTEGWTVTAALARVAPRSPVPPAPSPTPDGRLTRTAPAPLALRAAHPPAVASTGKGPRLSKDAYRRQKEALEADLVRLGLRKSQLELALAEPAVQSNFVELRRITSELADIDAALSAAEDAWLGLEERAPW